MHNYFASVFFFSSRRRHTRYWRDWSSDVCSSDLPCHRPPPPGCRERPSEHPLLRGSRRFRTCRQPDNLWPGADESVVGQRLLGPLLSLTEDVKPIGELSGGFTQAPDTAEERCRSVLPTRLQGPHEVLRHFPHGQPGVCGWIPGCGQLLSIKQSDFAA